MKQNVPGGVVFQCFSMITIRYPLKVFYGPFQKFNVASNLRKFIAKGEGRGGSKGSFILFEVGFLLEGALLENDHEFPFAGDVELLRRSLTGVSILCCHSVGRVGRKGTAEKVAKNLL